jgi:hypothetical protein
MRRQWTAKIYGSRLFGAFNNLPALKVYDVGGHVCTKICDIITQHSADRPGFEFSERLYYTPDIFSTQSCRGIHGVKAMDDIFAKIKLIRDTNGNHSNTKYFIVG